VNTSFEKKLKREIQSQKNNYWDKISQELPAKTKANNLKQKNNYNLQMYFKRLVPLAVSGAFALFAFFVITNSTKVVEPNIIKKQTVNLSDLVKMRDTAIEELQQGKQIIDGQNNDAKNNLQSTINYISKQ